MPISLDNVQLLKSKASRAPFGKGAATVLDVNVRDAWQIDGSSVWSSDHPAFFQSSVHKLARSSLTEFLGVDADAMGIRVNLYKLLVYQVGGHFLRHCDTEKEPGMFGTYLLQLPVEGGHTGGELIFTHASRRKVFPTETESNHAIQETLFYADCEHELRPITSGWRCVLAFNLTWRRGSDTNSALSIPMMVPVSHTKSILDAYEQLARFLDHWEKAGTSQHAMLAIPLEHKYTPMNISFQGLKGNDSTLAQSCMKMKGRLELFLFLKVLHTTRDGDSMYGEEMDRDYESNWVNVEDEEVTGYSIDETLDILGVDIEGEGELFSEDEADKEEKEGYQGNYGPTTEYWYYKTFLVLTPTKLLETVQLESNFPEFIDDVIEQATIDISHPNVVQIENPSEMARKLKIIQQHLKRVKASYLPLAVICEAMDEMELRDSFLQSLSESSFQLEASQFPHWVYLIRRFGWPAIQTRLFAKLWINMVDKQGLMTFVNRLIAAGDKAVAEEVFQWMVTQYLAVPAGTSRPHAAVYTEEFSLNMISTLLKRGEHTKEIIDDLASVVGSSSACYLQSFIVRHAQSVYNVANPEVRQLLKDLVTRRQQKLQKLVLRANNNTSWAVPILPSVALPANLVQFYQSENKELTVYGMSSVAHARNYGSKYVGPYRSYGLTHSEGGRGVDAYIKVKKLSRPHIDKLRRELNIFLGETNRVLAAINPVKVEVIDLT